MISYEEKVKGQTRNAWTPVITDRDSSMKVVQGLFSQSWPLAFGLVRDSFVPLFLECPLHSQLEDTELGPCLSLMVAHSQSIHFSYKGTVEGPKAQTHYTLVKANSNLMLRLEKHARTVSLQLLRRAAPVDQSVFDLPLSQFNSQYGAECEIRCKKTFLESLCVKASISLRANC